MPSTIQLLIHEALEQYKLENNYEQIGLFFVLKQHFEALTKQGLIEPKYLENLEEVNLTPREQQLFNILFNHLNEVVGFEEIIAEWDIPIEENYIFTLISRMRDKLIKYDIKSIRGQGYKLSSR